MLGAVSSSQSKDRFYEKQTKTPHEPRPSGLFLPLPRPCGLVKMEPLSAAFAGWLSLTLSGGRQPASRAVPLTAIPGESQSQKQNRNTGPLPQKSASYPSPLRGSVRPPAWKECDLPG
ncbi:rho guanine nucleotide exchange factor 40 [Platysternon megacephalum]|uniref:Rho guanine nucleotide exchange factor 40 n=1 Tax=Platysternon megacephalum TaxID=55544 RepID=A0A4D9DVP1_9SAUR|nr:rho guanine nucleotide exchange factor 40 [Platysternon megacephalum]